MRPVPETAANPDWARKVARQLRDITNRIPNFANLPDALDDVAASAAGVEVGGLYRTGSIVKVRIT